MFSGIGEEKRFRLVRLEEIMEGVRDEIGEAVGNGEGDREKCVRKVLDILPIKFLSKGPSPFPSN